MSEIGLECSLNEVARVSGTFKHLYEDFHVREIKPNGEIVQLRHLLLSESIRNEHDEMLKNEAGVGRLTADFAITEEEREQLSVKCRLDEDNIDALQKFIRAVARYEILKTKLADASAGTEEERQALPNADKVRELVAKCMGILLPPVLPDAEAKALRKAIHETLRSLFPFLETETVLTGDLFESQNKPQLFSSDASNLTGEFSEAAALKRVYEPLELLNLFQFSAFSDERLLPAVQTMFDAQTASGEGVNQSGEDSIKFFKVKVKKIATFHLTGRPLHQAPTSRDSASRWSSSYPPFLQFTLAKENRDTADAVSSIAAAMGVGQKLMSFAGTKDKRGVTVQRMSVYKVTKTRLLQSTTFRQWDRATKVCDIEYSNNRVALGDLSGNHFTIALRQLKGYADNGELINKADLLDRVATLAAKVRDFGFINYFGNQRFGTRRIKTWQPGAALFRGDLKEAVRLILASSVEFNPETDSWRDVSKKLRPHHTLENKVIQSLISYPADYNRALRQLHKNTLALYYHAVQSLLFNKAASERIRRNGLKLVVGDIVILPKTVTEEPSREAEPADADPEGEDDGNQDKVDAAEEEFTIEKFEVKAIESEEEAAKYSLEDLCLPLPGTGPLLFPSNLDGVYERLCQEFVGEALSCLTEESFHLTRIEGSYRRVLVKPKNFAFKVLENVGQNTPVLASDLDRLLGRPIAQEDTFTTGLAPLECQLTVPVSGETQPNDTAAAAEVSMDQCAAPEAPAGDSPLGSSTNDVLLISCSLPKSSYLTCLIREFLDEESISRMVNTREPQTFRNPRAGGQGGNKRSGMGNNRGRGGGNFKRRR